ncbi:MAG TPA: cytochrome c biogenesis protein CcdA [Fimbriimonadaceae bacterium]|nr:cytochrome c biogenesis protein CcdA [Fimbriimonadaceae bacterium]
MTKYFLALGTLLLLLLSSGAYAQEETNYASFTAKLEQSDVRAGEAARILVQVKTEPKWHIYGFEQPEGPISTTIRIEEGPVKVSGKPIVPLGVKKFDPNFEMELVLYEGQAVFALPVTIDPAASGTITAKVIVNYQACTDGTCDIPKDVPLDLTIDVAPGEARADRLAAPTEIPAQPAGYVESTGEDAKGEKGAPTAAEDEFSQQFDKAKDSGLIPFMWLSFVAGLLALLTPCVFPMIPITVSFFSKTVEGERKTNYSGALFYCLGIVATFTALGLIATVAFGASGIQQLATNPWVNIALVLVFVALALSLFGLFEIAIPSSLLTKLSGASRAAGAVGPLLMGLTFSLTSFTCTVPIVGTILAGAAAGGSLLYPIMGMLAFSTAFALPFFFLALFPSTLKKLPKSGGWLSTVKIFMGFLELAAALKFLSNVDLVWQLGWLTKPVFLAIWAAIAFIAAFQLIGWLKLPTESEGKIGLARRAVGVVTLVLAGYCLAAIEGVRLGEMEAFLPPDPYPGRASASGGHGSIAWKTNWDEGKQIAAAEGKPIFINFTGVTCTNCRWMEKNMFTRPEVSAEINKYVPVELFTDRTTEADLANRGLQKELTKVVTLPVYVLATPDGKPIRIFQGSTRDADEFLKFLRSGTEGAVARN